MITSVERILAADIAMGNFAQIDHIWMHPDSGWGRPTQSEGITTRTFRIDFRMVPVIGQRFHTEVILPFTWLFKVVVSSDRPRSVLDVARNYRVATVDENGWILGERTLEEAAQIPEAYRKISFDGNPWV